MGEKRKSGGREDIYIYIERDREGEKREVRKREYEREEGRKIVKIYF
jgi:hypothetical protein